MRNGVGEIALAFSADTPPDEGTHELTFENHQESVIAVYLVNALLPRDPDVRVLGQDRNYNQSAYHLCFASGGPASPSGVDEASGAPQKLDRR